MLEIKGRYFIDMGTPAIDHLVTAGIPIDAVKGIFITHMHGDHTNGLIHFVDLLSWYFKTSDPIIFLPNTECTKIIGNWLKVNYTSPRDLHYEEIQPGVIYNDGFLKVTLYKHFIPNALMHFS